MWDEGNRIRRSIQPDVTDMQVHVEHGCVAGDYPLHTHGFYETFIIVSGSAEHVLDERRCILRRGDAFCIGGSAAHAFQQVQDMEIINLMYEPDFFRCSPSEIRSIPGFDACFLVEPEMCRHRGEKPLFRLDDRALDYAVMMADFIQTQQALKQPELRPAIRMHFMALFSFLATQYEAHGAHSHGTPSISRALAYMERHLDEPLHVAQIAAETYFSVRQLERVFQECFGQSPMQYMRKLRMEKAMVLLQAGKSVGDTAWACGFEDPAYFTRVFRAQYGCLPTHVRRGAVVQDENEAGGKFIR